MFFLILNGIVLCVVSLALILVSLLQKPKGQGASPLATNSNMQELLGVAQMPSILVKVTYVLLVLLVVLTLSFTYLIGVNYVDVESA